jgi:hypothetical protein
LDYDCKKRKKSTSTAVTDEELNQAAEKFEDTRNQTDLAMQRLLGNEVEHITHLTGFAEGFLEYHRQCTEILRDMVKQLNEKYVSTSSKIQNKLNFKFLVSFRKMMAIKKAESNMHNNQSKNSNYNNNNSTYGSEKNSPLASRGFNNDPFATSATSNNQWPVEQDNSSATQIGFKAAQNGNGAPSINQRPSSRN